MVKQLSLITGQTSDEGMRCEVSGMRLDKQLSAISGQKTEEGMRCEVSGMR